jgi:hypothetical protein
VRVDVLARGVRWRQNAGPPVSQRNGGNRVKKVSQPIKKLFKQAKAHPLIAIPVAVLVVLLVGGAILVAGLGGDDGAGDKGEPTAKETQSPEKDPAIEKAKKHKVKPAPVVNGAGTLDVARSVGTFAVAQGRGQIKNPSTISVRVSAAPKQTVTVDYQLACYKESGTKIGKGRYRPRPPDVRTIPIPLSGAKECIVTVGAQLTSHRPGRIKVAIISG